MILIFAVVALIAFASGYIGRGSTEKQHYTTFTVSRPCGDNTCMETYTVPCDNVKEAKP